MSNRNIQEQVLLSDHQNEENKLICLRCGNEHKEPKHSQYFDCDCGIEYVAYGNSLFFF